MGRDKENTATEEEEGQQSGNVSAFVVGSNRFNYFPEI